MLITEQGLTTKIEFSSFISLHSLISKKEADTP
jgi:hypothetical protein